MFEGLAFALIVHFTNKSRAGCKVMICIDTKFYCFLKQLWTLKHIVKDVFIGAKEVGEMIPLPVWIIPFPLIKTSFLLGGTN